MRVKICIGTVMNDTLLSLTVTAEKHSQFNLSEPYLRDHLKSVGWLQLKSA